ncbi:hypothetical protein BLNAU_9618 [Blattamonas nauphoetae]|uniref:Uncharacterized protein n=1 Tax=Blattamonas nauphoetae TaxID=2049346 RepID=A0ABQ9XV84_9EUKA|nr:hypothetical protein BLNAU_9618 [Blattamonas nauphoetae]
MLAPLDSNPNKVELSWLSEVGNVVESLHWLSFPSHFDSPLLCLLPSLAGAQRGVLQPLSSHSGIPSLVTPITFKSYWNIILKSIPKDMSFNHPLRMLTFTVRYMGSNDFNSPSIVLIVLDVITDLVRSPTPALVSAAFEFFHRLVTVSSDARRIDLVKRGLLDHIVFAVSNSSFLDDYEKGIAVIGTLLATIRRSDLKRRMRVFDFSPLF